MIDRRCKIGNINAFGKEIVPEYTNVAKPLLTKCRIIMKPITLRVAGSLLEEDGRSALLISDFEPERDAEGLIALRFALITRGPEEHIFPAFLLDDWGNEVRGRSLFTWAYEEGDRFPRAEIFGFEQDGRETQVFLRELELYARLPCYAYRSPEVPLPEGVLLNAILLPQADVQAPQRIKPPADLQRPLAAARVSWWHVPPGTTSFDFSHLDRRP